MEFYNGLVSQNIIYLMHIAGGCHDAHYTILFKDFLTNLLSAQIAPITIVQSNCTVCDCLVVTGADRP